MFAFFQRLLPKRGDFFGMFEAHAATLVAAAAAIQELAKDGTTPKGLLESIQDYEHRADDLFRDVLHAVRQTFLTPFDRGAITGLIGAMDDSIDEMLSAARAIDIYQLKSFRPEMKEMVGLMVEAANLTAEAVPLLRDVSGNGQKLHELTARLTRLEGQADDIHAKGLKLAYQEVEESGPMAFAVTREVFKHLERVMDAFEDVANRIDDIVIDHA